MKNLKMKATDIDEEYCISAVFEGNFRMHLIGPDKKRLDEEESEDPRLPIFCGV